MATSSKAVAVNEDIHPVVQLIMQDETYLEESDGGYGIAEQLMQATSPEELLSDSASEVTHSGDVIGRPFMLHSVRFRPGDLNAEIPVFALLEVTWDGEETTDLVSCGGLNTMVAAKTLKDRGWLPRMVVIEQSKKKTRAGYFALNLRDAAPHVVEGKSF